jgi:hypothetical protein
MPAFLGFVLFCGLVLAFYLFTEPSKQKRARDLEWLAIVVAVLGLIIILLAERFVLLWLPLAIMAYPGWRRMRAVHEQRFVRKPQAATLYLRVDQDGKSDKPIGTVVHGTFAGSRLSELARDELIILLKEARVDDPEGAALIEDYLDYAQPGWRGDLVGDEEEGSGERDMSVRDARRILGVGPDADEAAIAHAYGQLMRRLQSDHGGNDYFAEKLTRARDVLLKRR